MKNFTYVLRLKKKQLIINLTNIYGINNSFSKKICSELGIQKSFKTRNLTEQQKDYIVNKFTTQYITGLKLKHKKKELKKEILLKKNYKSFQHRYGLPVRGQRTSTNAKTRKKNKNAF